MKAAQAVQPRERLQTHVAAAGSHARAQVVINEIVQDERGADAAAIQDTREFIELFNPTGSELALRALPFHQSGLAAGANDTFRQTGVAVGIAALGTLVPAGSALGGNPQAYVDGLHHALIVSAAIALTGAVAMGLLLIPARSPVKAEAVPETA